MSQQKPIVFVVDDDISVRESLELLIRSAGWLPELFESAKQFLSRPRPLVANCLILDVNLPDLNGLDLQKLVSVERTEMPIIFVTGYGDVPMTVKAMKAGAVEFLTKPFDDDSMIAAIAQAQAQVLAHALAPALSRVLAEGSTAAAVGHASADASDDARRSKLNQADMSATYARDLRASRWYPARGRARSC